MGHRLRENFEKPSPGVIKTDIDPDKFCSNIKVSLDAMYTYLVKFRPFAPTQLHLPSILQKSQPIHKNSTVKVSKTELNISKISQLSTIVDLDRSFYKNSSDLCRILHNFATVLFGVTSIYTTDLVQV